MLPIETTLPRQLLMPPPQQCIGSVLSRSLGDGEGIEVGSIRTRDGGFFFFVFLHGADPVPPRNLLGGGASPLHHQHWHAGMWMFPVEPGSVRLLLDLDIGGVGRRLEGLGSRHAALGFLGGDGGGEDEQHQHYGEVDEVRAAYRRTLRLRGGAADDDWAAGKCSRAPGD